MIIRTSSKLLFIMVLGATLWGWVVVLFASSRLNISFQITKDMKSECNFGRDDNIDRRVARHLSDDHLPDHTDKYAREIFVQSGDPSLAKMCTMVMLTYRRVKVLMFLLNHYCKVKSLHKIIVIWNDVDRSIPDDVLDMKDKCVTDLLFIREKENKLTNRFKPRPEIETDCVCIIDDDRFIVDLRDLEFGLNVWQNFRHRVVGFEHRTHIKLSNGSFWYDLTDFSRPRTNYSMILTSTAIIHKTYLKMFFDSNILPKGMIDYIDKIKNCEDIALNIMVAKFLDDLGKTQAAALALKPKREVRNMEKSMKEGPKKSDDYQGLSSLPDHYIERSRCLNDFRDLYGGSLHLPHATFIMENMAPRVISRRNRTYSLRLWNATRTFQAHNSTFQGHFYPGNFTHPYLRRNQSNFHRWRPVVNGSHRYLKRPYNMTYPLKQSKKYSSLYLKNAHNSLNPNLRKTYNYVRWNGTELKIKSHPLRPLNTTRLYSLPHKMQDQPVAPPMKDGDGNSLVNRRQRKSDG